MVKLLPSVFNLLHVELLGIISISMIVKIILVIRVILVIWVVKLSFSRVFKNKMLQSCDLFNYNTEVYVEAGLYITSTSKMVV